MDSQISKNEYSIIRFNLLTSLLAILNQNDEDDTSFVIANYILNNLKDMEKRSIYKVAEDCFVSRSSIQRFVKEIGYENYTQMKQSLAEVISHEEALLDYTDHTDFSNYILESISTMAQDITETAKKNGFKNLLDRFTRAKSIVILVAEDSSHACKLFQQQLLAAGKLIRIATSAGSNISFLNTLDRDDLLIVCSVTGNFALAVTDQLKDINATKCLITLNRTTVFLGQYSIIYYLGDKIKPSSRSIRMFKNVYTNYGLSLFFDLLFHAYFRSSISPGKV
ncbi:MAG: MurR/RpiR family transcriptional regulator [Flexilinea sp.]|nr:MurR/RpiR family transcriptional regulator [Flexilinea sp.]